MFYRETGQYKTDYAADMALFPIRQDRIGIALILLVALVLTAVLAGMQTYKTDDGKSLGDAVVGKIKTAVQKVEF